MQLLLNAGARIDSVGYTPDGSDRSCLMWAAEVSCCTEPLKLLLQRGADPCYVSRADGTTALRIAVARGLYKNCQLLLAARGGQALLHHQQAVGQTPLWLAVGTRHVEVVKVLQQHGADLHAVNARGGNFLHTVTLTMNSPGLPGTNEADSLTMLRHLLSEGLNVDATCQDGDTPLHCAVINGSVAAVKLLLEHGADSSIKDAFGYTALNSACDLGHTAIVKLLLQHGADITVTVEVDETLGVTALMLSVQSGHTDVAKVLLAKGADVNAVDQQGCSALIYAAAARSSCAESIKLLLQHGADPHVRSEINESALLTAVVKGDAQCTQLLVNAGADVNMRCGAMLPGTTELAGSFGIDSMTVTTVNDVLTIVLTDRSQRAVPTELRDAATDDLSKTVLMAADTPAAVKVLLAAGADVHRTTDQGGTCLHTAAALNYPAPVICLLIKAGVDLRAVNSKGKTAAAVAHDKGNTLAAALLDRAARDV
jgi:uncharacterized protein